MTGAAKLRAFLSWFLFVGAAIALWVSANGIVDATALYGSGYPLSLSRSLPAFTRHYLDVYRSIPTAAAVVIGAAAIAALAISKLCASREAQAHGIALLAGLLYYLAVIMWAGFVAAFFVLPKAMAGI